MDNSLGVQPKSSVLIVGHPQEDKVQLGAHCVRGAPETLSALSASKYSTIVFHLDDFSMAALESLRTHFKQTNENIISIIIKSKSDQDKLIYAINYLNAYQIINDYEDPEFEKIIFSANEAFAEQQQRTQLIELFNEQNNKLTILKDNLEERIKKRKKSLTSSQKRFELLSHAVQVLHKSLIAIHTAKSLSEIQQQLSTILGRSLPIKSAYIISASAISKFNTQADVNFTLPLVIRGQQFGVIHFNLTGERDLLKDEVDILTQIADATALSADRLTKRQLAETLKQHWEAAFNSIQDSICLANSQFQIIRTNDSFVQNKLKAIDSIIGQNCFDVFFEDSEANKNTQKVDGHLFFQKTQTRLKETKARIFDVTIQKIPYIEHEDDLNLIYFRNVTENLRLERQLLESSKMAELGTIASSIAHELNNPLGGMISFLQLIKMDLNSDNKNYCDIEAMLESSLRCKDIVENLLGFARRTQGNMNEEVKINHVLEQSLKILALQTKSTNINIEFENPNEDIFIRGNFNLLTQAICNILQNSVDAIKLKYADHPRYDGQIRIELNFTKSKVILIISDNGTGIKPEYQNLVFNPLFTTKNPDHNSGLGLTVSFQIVNEHGGSLDIFSQPMAGTSAKITFLRLDY